MNNKSFYVLFLIIFILGVILFVDTHNNDYSPQMTYDKSTVMGQAIDKYNNGEYKEAIELLAPQNAVENYNNYDAYILIAESYYNLGEFEKTVDVCNSAIVMSPRRADSYRIKGYALYGLGRNTEALECYDKVLELSPKDPTIQNYKGNALIGAGRYKEALECYNAQLELDPKLSASLFGRGRALYFTGEYRDALDAFDNYIEMEPEDPDGYSWKAKCFTQLDEYEKGFEFCDKALQKDANNAFAHTTKGWIYYRQGKDGEAMEEVNKAIELDKKDSDAYEGKAAMLYNQRRYNECIKFANEAIKLFPSNEDLHWYVADCYYSQYEHEKAIEKYKEVLRINPGNASVTSYIGWEYMALQEYDKAEEYADKAMSIDKESQLAKDLKKEIEETNNPDNKRIVDFVKENYLYIDKVKDFEVITKRFTNKSKINANDIFEYIDNVRLKDDIFTYVIQGKEYDLFMAEEEIGHTQRINADDDTVHIKIGMFTTKTAAEFKRIIDSVKDTENKNLVIDLRDNYGGLIGSANEILDYLLPDCVASNIIYRDGYSDSYNSDNYQVKFKKILILVNQNTASSSEILTLGLKKYLNNVVIIGKPTLGKGVGQHVFENKAEKYAVYLVSFYWNVREQNIMGSRIEPDIEVKGDKYSYYMDILSKQLIH